MDERSSQGERISIRSPQRRRRFRERARRIRAEVQFQRQPLTPSAGMQSESGEPEDLFGGRRSRCLD